jgi:predicted outer membrane protein
MINEHCVFLFVPFLEGINMQLTKRLLMARAALVFVAVVSAGAAWQVNPAAGQEKAAVKDKPTVSYWHVWTDEKGGSHQERRTMSAFNLQSISEGAAPSWIDKQSTPGAAVLMVVQPVGWVGEWHENPKPQWIIPLSGRWFVETMDGMRVEMGPGEVSFGGDQNTKPDAQGRKGHRSGTVGNQPSVNLIVQLEKDPFVRGQDFAPSAAKTQLGPVDTYFVTQTSLGTPFQTDSGRIAQKEGGTQAIRTYAELMVSSHIAVNDALEAVMKRKAPVPPPTLLKAAYGTITSTLAVEKSPRFDVEYVRCQVAYQKANAALYQYEIDNGADPDLKAFAQETLPKIQDHLGRALELERELKGSVVHQ